MHSLTLLLTLSKTEAISVDPVTAACNLGAALFNYLSTPAGQKFADLMTGLDASFLTKVGDVFNMIHSKLPKGGA